jgi:hypothetical protein
MGAANQGIHFFTVFLQCHERPVSQALLQGLNTPDGVSDVHRR